MPEVEFEPMIPVFERKKTVNALDRAATVIGVRFTQCFNITVREKAKIRELAWRGQMQHFVHRRVAGIPARGDTPKRSFGYRKSIGFRTCLLRVKWSDQIR
jgi:hypothetical protein